MLEVSIAVALGPRESGLQGGLLGFLADANRFQKVVRRFHHAGDAELDRAIGEFLRERPATAQERAAAEPAAAGPTLTLKTAVPPGGPNRTRLLVFEGDGAGRIHRPGPEHFRLTRVSDGETVSLALAYERESLDDREPSPRQTVRRLPPVREVYPYNHLFKGVRLILDTGPHDAKDEARTAGHLDLYGRARLEAGVRYRLTWACWPVGASEAKEVSHEFEFDK
jgi:hypothetical protein